MRSNITKHRILKILNESSLNEKKNHKINDYIDITKAGVSFDDLGKTLNLSKERILEICFALGSTEEVEPFNINNKDGISIRLKGTEALISKKYLTANKRILLSYLEDFAKIFIPIIMATIAVFSLYLNFRVVDSYEKKYQELQMQLRDQSIKLDDLTRKIIYKDSIK